MRGSVLAALVAGGLLSGACATTRGPATRLAYPVARTSSQVDVYHGTSVADPYRWLEDDRSTETEAWVEAQEALARRFLDGLPLRAELEDRLVELWDLPRRSAPVRHGGVHAWTTNTGLQPHPVMRVGTEPLGEGRVLFDPNAWSDDGSASLSGTSFTRTGHLVAHARSDSGSDWRTWRVRVVDTGEDLADEIRWVKTGRLAWLPDETGFYYTAFPPPETGRELTARNLGARVYLHRLGTAQSDDLPVHGWPDHPEWLPSAQVTEDGRWLVLFTWHGTSRRNLVHARRLDRDFAPLIPLDESWDTDLELIGNDGSVFYFLTHVDAPLGRIVAIDAERPERGWTTLVPEGSDALQAGLLLRDRLVLTVLRDARHALVLRDLSGGHAADVELPGPGSVRGLRAPRADSSAFFTFESFTRPAAVYRLDAVSGSVELAWAPEASFDPDAHVTEQVFVERPDGARVPLFLTRRRDVRPDRRRPAYLTGYGGFAISLTPRYSARTVAWLERGGIHALAILPGGGEYGEDWHSAGMLANKQRVFDDFAAAARWLVESGWTRPRRIAAAGQSNGGLLVGALLTQSPDLIGCALPAMGVLDMLRYHRFTIGHAWIPEYGSADDPDQFPFLHAYSPLHAVRAGTRYPPTLVMTADHDDRVVPGHSFKFAASLQAAQAGRAPILLRVERRAGHGRGRPTAARIGEAADELAFALWATGKARPLRRPGRP